MGDTVEALDPDLDLHLGGWEEASFGALHHRIGTGCGIGCGWRGIDGMVHDVLAVRWLMEHL